MVQIFGTNPSAQALIEHNAIKEDPKWEAKQKELQKQANETHATHKATIKKMLGHIGDAVDAHGSGKDISWHDTGELHHVHKHLLEIRKYLSPNKYDNDSAIVPAISPVRSY